MSSKHFFDDPTHLVLSALESIALTNPAVAFDKENKIVYRRPSESSQISVVSGGGSGHEPSFASFVGPGLLAGAVAGTIFASPSAEQVRRCILRRVDSSQGVLVIVMNYTGDVLNFGMAVEKAKAAGLQVEMVVVGDDAGVGRSAGGKVGRRGIAGTVLVQKIASAMAASGATLEQVSEVARLTASNVVSIGASLSHVHVPGREKTQAEDALSSDEVELGMGIHNEAGVQRMSTTLPELVGKMLECMLSQDDQDRAFINIADSNEVVLLVNNLGGLSPLELGGITTEVLTQLKNRHGQKPVRVFSGTYMTSLNALGFSISLLKVVDIGPGGGMLKWLDSPVEASGWTTAVSTGLRLASSIVAVDESTDDEKIQTKPSGLTVDMIQVKSALSRGLQQVIAAEPEVTRYDTAVGDGDCGIGLKRGAEAIESLLRTTKSQDAATLIDEIVGVVETNMDGTSGALYAIFLNALATGLRQEGQRAGKQTITVEHWGNAADYALQSLSKYTPAKPGDRTLVDALSPFISTLKTTQSLEKAAQAAQRGADETKGMKASLGRTVYVGDQSWQEVPDPGAYGLAKFFTGLAAAL